MAQSSQSKRPRRRTSLFAAFTSGGEPVHNVFHWNRAKLDTLMAERQANGTAFPGEHVVQITIAFYRQKLVENGFPIPAGLEQGEPVVQSEPKFSLSLSRDEVSHLLSALDASIADIEARAALPGESAESVALGSALLEVNRALRGRVAGLLVHAELQG